MMSIDKSNLQEDINCGVTEDKGGDNMAAILEKKRNDLQSKLNKISAKAPALKTNKGMIELNVNNSKHREWFETDKYKGQ